MMKRVSILLTAFALVLMIGLSSCNQDGGPLGEGYNLYDAPEFQAPEADNSPVDITAPSLDQPFQIIPLDEDYRCLSDDDFMGSQNGSGMMGDGSGSGMMMGGGHGDHGGHGNGNNDHWKGHRDRFMPLARVLRSLNLTADQRDQLKDFIFNYRLCLRDAIIKLRETERELISGFKDKRDAIITAYRNGEITREEAMDQLMELRDSIRETLRNNDARVIACEAMKLCKKDFFASIRGMLTEEQQAIWDEWVSNLPERDCNDLQQ